MKKSVKITCIVAASCIVLGLLILLGVSVKFGFDYRKLDTTTVEVQTYAVEQPFENIDVCSLENDVTFSLADDGQCKVVCTQTERKTCTVSVENGTLTVAQNDIRRWYERFGIYWGAGDTPEMKIEIFLPSQEYCDLSVSTQSGNIWVDEPFLFETADLSASSGEIYFGTYAERLTVYSTSGDIACACVGNTASLKVESNSGGIELGKLHLEIFAARSLTVATTSGDVEFVDSDADELDIRSNSGCITGDLRTAKNFEVSTTSGEVDVSYSKDSAGKCYVETTSGDITLHTP